MRLPAMITTQDGWLHTPTILFRNTHKKEILLIGVCHWGSITYWQEIQRLLDFPENQTVLMEGVAWTPTEMLHVLGIALDECREYFDFDARWCNAVKEHHGIAYQGYALVARTNWNFARVSTAEIKTLQAVVKELLARPPLAAQHAQCMQSMPETTVHVVEVIQRAKQQSEQKKIYAYTERDQQAAHLMLQMAQTGRVAACWGTHHIRGVGVRLKKAGFKPVEIRWLPFLPETLNEQGRAQN